MAGTQWTSKRRTLVISTFVLTFAAFLWVAAPQLVPTAELLGSDWQCTKTAFVLTTCTLFPQPYTDAQNTTRQSSRADRCAVIISRDLLPSRRRIAGSRGTGKPLQIAVDSVTGTTEATNVRTDRAHWR